MKNKNVVKKDFGVVNWIFYIGLVIFTCGVAFLLKLLIQKAIVDSFKNLED